jgi:hypothetical protein
MDFTDFEKLFRGYCIELERCKKIIYVRVWKLVVSCRWNCVNPASMFEVVGKGEAGSYSRAL